MTNMHQVISKWLKPLAFGLFCLTTNVSASDRMVDLVGLNVAGAEFTSGALPGVHGTHYFFPSDAYFKSLAERGIQTIRFPIKWERLQPALNVDFDLTYARLIDNMLLQAEANGIAVILDVHNYARYRGNVIGSAQVPFISYRNLLERIAQRWGNSPSLYGYDIMNEPYGAADALWPKAAQAGIDGVRLYDRQRPIFIEGASYSSAARWQRYADALLDLRDPVDNLIFSAHVYLDPDASGSYREPPAANFDPRVGIQRVTPFVEWLKKHNKRGHIGELGIPGDDPRWLHALDLTMQYLQDNCIPMTYWAGGPAWGNYKLSIEPGRDGSEKPQWKVLKKYLGKGNCPEYGPNVRTPQVPAIKPISDTVKPVSNTVYSWQQAKNLPSFRGNALVSTRNNNLRIVNPTGRTFTHAQLIIDVPVGKNIKVRSTVDSGAGSDLFLGHGGNTWDGYGKYPANQDNVITTRHGKLYIQARVTSTAAGGWVELSDLTVEVIDTVEPVSDTVKPVSNSVSNSVYSWQQAKNLPSFRGNALVSTRNNNLRIVNPTGRTFTHAQLIIDVPVGKKIKVRSTVDGGAGSDLFLGHGGKTWDGYGRYPANQDNVITTRHGKLYIQARVTSTAAGGWVELSDLTVEVID